ncbi:MAG: 50S ribosomal protein L25 [Ignavibacteria bacterium CG_4_8_14_3_um_filter_37_9]|nr:50S ribosomal protein L25 [Ignavibacteria bacterium]PIP78505.1 MAG: 50S ribosomal protein L25 [Ignavibacteria bacterium CG22_combo_CG10-13_8_21_14_all_37_15]PIS43946.1 MAG: 50S ribosomal protein L25 [Ignavibacteria bacterium CG08_land_8_20_14_0_20_37_9]PIW99372.1 MAG: 50S ribosomal protein L25 [Ignavibacteria bacterium CG_4_8_14_3_um_filter_37_9]PIX93640.1 MAG: 50S ribosomal protein L25 [Ignavibacteria bacterium CG_4_10_14_3_um_filter_37_18]PJC60815.1 MAG: 50S ribosomal protein L25 [Ignavib
MDKITLNGIVRQKSSKSSMTQLRNSARVPGILYAKGLEPISVDVSASAINSLVFTTKTHLINLALDNQKEFDCVLKEYQFDPVSDKVIHFDLQGIVAGQKIEIDIPIQFTGSAIGVREGGQLQEFMHKLTVLCLPSQIPEQIEINIADLKIGSSIHVADLKVENAEILHAADAVIVGVVPPKVIEEEVKPETEVAKEPEVVGKGKEKSEEV